MTTSTIRFILIAALVVGGIVLINQAFPEGASAGGGVVPPAAGGGTTGATAATGPTASSGATGATAGQPADVPSPQIDGVAIAVFNTTNVPGLAQDLSDQLTAEGYVEGQAPGNAELSPNSRIFFRGPKDQADAEYIANTYFGKYGIVPAKLEPGSDVGRDVQVAIYIGNDYAADHSSG